MSLPPWTPNFDFYFAQMRGAPAVIALDLAAAEHAPVEGHGRRLSLRVPMKEARPDGLRSREEFDALSALEDRLAEALGYTVDGWMVGRVVYRGNTDLFFYLPTADEDDEDERIDSIIEAARGDYEISRSIDEDTGWGFYFDFLWPDRAAMQSMGNRRVLMQLSEAGDDPTRERVIDHFAFFEDAKTCKRIAAELREHGFDVDEPTERDDGSWALQFHRTDALANGRIDEVTAEILGIIGEDDGAYDGWGCPVQQLN
ncbi:MAG: DUF695 domain-containing protein [Nannocystaceae bacterium]|jgi:regulator of RNase E activity RraB